MSLVANVRVGRPQISPTATSHVRGIREGNQTRKPEHEQGMVLVGDGARGTARRSTGINPSDRDPIDPNMPNLSPA